MLARAGASAWDLTPGAALGTLLLGAALVRGGAFLAGALWSAGGTYIGFLAASGATVDPTAPLVAALLFLCGELSGWSLDERWRVRAEPSLAWRRAAAVGGLALAGLTVATLAVALAALPGGRGVAWTLAGAAAAVGAAGTGVWAARRF